MRNFKLENQILATAKSRAKKKGLPFNLELSDIIVPNKCPLLGIKLQRNGVTDSKDSSPSIDRKNPSLGYVKGNVWIISQKANRVKNNATFQEFEKIYKNVMKEQKNKTASISFRLDKPFKDKIISHAKDLGTDVDVLSRQLWIEYFSKIESKEITNQTVNLIKHSKIEDIN